MQLTLNLTFTPAPPIQRIFQNNKKVEISQPLSDVLGNEDDHDQQLYDALWMAHHYLVLDQRPSFSFTFDFMRDDKISSRFIETSLRLHVEEKEQVILLGLLQDF